MWLSVVQQALVDYVAHPNSNIKEFQQEHLEAQAWLFSDADTPEFQVVCDYAGLDYDTVRRAARKLRRHCGTASTRHERNTLITAACTWMARASD